MATSLVHNWDLDSPSGAVQDHVILDSIFRQATEEAKLMRLVNPARVSGGESFTVIVVGSLSEPTSPRLEELQPIPLDHFTVTSTKIDSYEEGRAVMLTKKQMRRFRDMADLASEARRALADQQARVIDTAIANSLDDMPIKYSATGVASQTITTTGTASGSAVSNLNVYHLRYIRNYLKRNRLVPYRSFGGYAGAFSTAAISGLKDDPEFLLYAQRMPEILRNGGFESMVESIALMEVVHDNALSDTLGSGSNIGEGFVVGADACYFGVINEPMILWERISGSGGRFYSLSWVADYGVGLPNTSANAGLCRGLHFTSA